MEVAIKGSKSQLRCIAELISAACSVFLPVPLLTFFLMSVLLTPSEHLKCQIYVDILSSATTGICFFGGIILKI